MWFLRGVDDLVSTKSARLSESLATDLADERSGAGVHGHVACQVVMRVEYLPALGTCERLRGFCC